MNPAKTKPKFTKMSPSDKTEFCHKSFMKVWHVFWMQYTFVPSLSSKVLLSYPQFPEKNTSALETSQKQRDLHLLSRTPSEEGF